MKFKNSSCFLIQQVLFQLIFICSTQAHSTQAQHDDGKHPTRIQECYYRAWRNCSWYFGNEHSDSLQYSRQRSWTLSNIY